VISGLFLLLYGCFRFIVEWFREPDSHIGFDLFEWMTRGQILCLPMMAAGVLLIIWGCVRVDSKTVATHSTGKEVK
jgi:phosphatidylglycerol:prolipoprotein diacylglycerol transferase